MKKTIISISVLLSACASTPEKGSKVSPLGETKASYSEKTVAVNLGSFKPSSNCPKDTKFNGMDWRKMVSLANACVKAKDWRKVELLGSELGISAHLTPWGPYFLSLAAESRKDYPRAVWMLELALKKAPNEGIFHYQLGRIHWQLGDEADAIKELKLASDLNPSLADAHYVMGQLALQKENYSEAERLLRKTLGVERKHWPATMALASLRMKKADWSQAVSLLESAIDINPKSSKARLALAQVQEQHLKKLGEALQTYRELRGLAQRRQLDSTVPMNLDEKIQMLEKAMTSAKGNKLSVREPSSQGKAAQ